MAPYTLELLLKTMLPWLDAAVDTARKPATGGLLEVKISISGPPTTPTLKVPVVPDADMSTPFSTPVAFSGIVPGPTACCLCANAGAEQPRMIATQDKRTSIRFM